MRTQKNEAGTLLPMTVIEGIIVNVLPNSQHEFLLSTTDVAIGYGVTEYAVRKTKIRHEDELKEGTHFLSAGTICPGDPHNKIYFTKRGIVRLGFFIKSERAKLFRDWAEELIIRLDEQRDLFGSMVVHQRALPAKRKHNRLTQERMIDILADVCKIEDKDLRLSISTKLMGGLA